MEKVDFESLKKEISAFNFKSESVEDWQRFFDSAVKLVDADDPEIKTSAIHRYYQGCREELEPIRDATHETPPIAERLAPMLEALTRQTEHFEPCFMTFAHWMSWRNDDVRRAFLDWLDKSVNSGIFPQLSHDMVLMAKLEFNDFPQSNWEEAKGFLMPCFANGNPRVRAAAGGALARLYEQVHPFWNFEYPNRIELPPIDQMMTQIKNWDIEHPGIAGPFWTIMEFELHDHLSSAGVTFDATQWMLDIIEHRKGQEPDVECYNGIDFHAHEQMAGDPKAIRKLIELGQVEIAAAAATELDGQIEGIEDILIELGSSSDELVSRICCWHLAYEYDYLHPEAEKQGFVTREDRPDVHVYLVFSKEYKRPYALTLYPNNNGPMDDQFTWSWIAKIVPKPEAIRETPDANDWEVSCNKQSVDFGGTIVSLHGDVRNKLWNHVWIKWPRTEGW